MIILVKINFFEVDIDKSELVKKTVVNNVDLSINTDLNKFFNEFNCELVSKENHKEFKEWAKKLKSDIQFKMKAISTQMI